MFQHASTVWSRSIISALALVLTACGSGNDDSAVGGELANPPEPTSGAWQLIWEDQFTGSSLDATKWDIQMGNGAAEGVPGWGNNELQYYTSDNLIVADGKLTIEARADNQAAPGFDYTSGRVRTQGKMDFTFGRVEASMRLPVGQGLWSAFWMLGTEPGPYGGWAAKGEIDIVEAYQPNSITSAIHYGSYFPQNEVKSALFEDFDPSDGFHTYAVEWDADFIRFFVDGTNHFTIRKEAYYSYYYKDAVEGFVEGGASAPFDADQHILLNLAVGGDLPGAPSDPSVFPAQMEVDYVRVYACEINPATGRGCEDSIDPVNNYISFDADPDAPAISTYDLYSDGFATLFEGTDIYRDLASSVYDNNGALSFSEVAGDDGRLVMDISTSGGGNVSIVDATAGSTFRLVNMGSVAAPGGSADFKFKAKVISAETDPAGKVQFKVDSGFPDVAFTEISIADLPQDEWGEVSVRLSDILAGGQGAFGGGPANVDELLSLLTIELTGMAHVQIADVSLQCGAKAFCGIEQKAVNPLVIFDDAVGVAWTRGITGYDTVVGGDYTSAQGNHISWELLDTGEEGHDVVIETTVSDSGASGLTFIGADGEIGVDFIPWIEGELAFDVKVISNPNGYAMKFKLDSPGYFQGERDLGVLPVGEWKTIRVPLSVLATTPVDLSKVTAFALFPSFGGQDVVFQWDNVRVETTVTEVVDPNEVLSTDFEDLQLAVDAAPGSSVGGGWKATANVFSPDGSTFYYSYGAPFPAPNGGAAFSAVELDGDNQYLNVYSDYNNGDAQQAGDLIEAIVLQEFFISADSEGALVFTFDARLPEEGLVDPASAAAFIMVLDPENNYAVVDRVELDLGPLLSAEWKSFSVTMPQLSPGLSPGLLTQFGFNNKSASYTATGVHYDNVDVRFVPALFAGSFDDLQLAVDAAPGSSVGGGWKATANVFSPDGSTFYYSYGAPFPAPNGGAAFSAVELDGDNQYLNVYSDYNNGDAQQAGDLIEAIVLQEFFVEAPIGQDLLLMFDARRPEEGLVDPASATAFIMVLDPENNYAVVDRVELDLGPLLTADWQAFELALSVGAEPLQPGLLVQFGFNNKSASYTATGVHYDNVILDVSSPEDTGSSSLIYATDFESSDASAAAIGDGWTGFGNVFESDGATFIYNYGAPFPAPNGGAFAAISTGEAGPEQGLQYLTVFSDYGNNSAHDAGQVVETIVFQQFELEELNEGVYRFSFDAKLPGSNALDTGVATAAAFILVLDPSAGYSTVARVDLDMTDILTSDWDSYRLEMDLGDGLPAGLLVQFGFNNRASGYASTGVVYDNVEFRKAVAPTVVFTGDFEASDASAAAIGDGWTGFGNVFESDGATFIYNYGAPFPAPNGGAFAAISTGEAGPGQGLQYLNVFSDYGNNSAHDAGQVVETIVFQQIELTEPVLGFYRLSFDAKLPGLNALDTGVATAAAFILVLDPSAGYSTVARVDLDVTNILTSDWDSYMLEMDLGDGLSAGLLVQFGFNNRATSYADTGVFYDNIVFEKGNN